MNTDLKNEWKPLPEIEINQTPRGATGTVPVARLAAIQKALDDNGIDYEVLAMVFSFNGGPQRVRINFHGKEDVTYLRGLIDSGLNLVGRQ